MVGCGGVGLAVSLIIYSGVLVRIAMRNRDTRTDAD